jgi:hypothetical protein
VSTVSLTVWAKTSTALMSMTSENGHEALRMPFLKSTRLVLEIVSVCDGKDEVGSFSTTLNCWPVRVHGSFCPPSTHFKILAVETLTFGFEED